ncbi:cupin domain-containing protein [Streptomyces sp. NPDC060000]|uniref:cupin domain-containing protein n=1 Tax=Streptomyces sp. NPDC060000 TaxID=3347031 RepID=UPI00369E9682
MWGASGTGGFRHCSAGPAHAGGGEGKAYRMVAAVTAEDGNSSSPADGAPVPRILFDTGTLDELGTASTGAVWRLSEPGRQLDANIVRIPAEQHVEAHAEPDLDVLLLVVAGEGTLVTSDGPCPLSEGSLTWLPHGSTRGLVAGERGMSYLTVHRRRPGMRIQPAGSHRDRGSGRPRS